MCLCIVCLLTAGGDKQGTGAVSHIGGVLALTRPPASSYNPWRVHRWQSNISEAATALTTVYLMFIILPSYVRMCHLVHYRRYTGGMRSLVTGHNVLVLCCGTMITLRRVVAGDSHHFLRSCLLRATQATVGAGWRMCSLCAAASSRHL